MALRIGFDIDGVLADFESAYHEVEVRLFGPGASSRADDPEKEEEEEATASPPESAAEKGKPDTTTDAKTEGAAPSARQMRRRHDAIWTAIRDVPDFWRTLKPIDEGAVARIHALMIEHRWEVFFITQRPATRGNTVQRQTQLWLLEQGFDLPSVLVLGGSRGAAAGALRLDYHVDDSAQNCVDVRADSRAKPILIIPDRDPLTAAKAKKLGIGTAGSISECLDILAQATVAHRQPGVFGRLAAFVGWK